ncbi:MAG: hypothetical protein GY842_03005, partial [bacterium]|nr:hypothetical protein [bacterium]
MPWDNRRKNLRERFDNAMRAEISSLRFRERFDPVMIALVALVFAVLTCAILIAVEVGRRAGRFNPPAEFRPVPDERILTNLRHDLAEQPLAAAAYHAPEKALFIARKGGLIHRYDPETGLWSEERAFADASLVKSNELYLRSGCGADPQSRHRMSCADPESLWLVGKNGGLVQRRRRGDWRVLLSEPPFMGTDEQLVEGDALISAAISDDGQWLLFGTEHQGVGLYHVPHGEWVSTEPVVSELEGKPQPEVRHLRWWKGQFWIGTPRGLFSLKPERSRPRAIPAGDIAGSVLALEVEKGRNGRLLVLEEKLRCSNGRGCLRLSTRGGFPSSWTKLFDECYLLDPQVKLADFFFADLQDGEVVVAGTPGVFAYDPELHSWRLLDDKSVLSVWKRPGGGGFYYGYEGGAGLVKEGKDP